MHRAFAVVAVVALLCLMRVAQADVFNLGAGYTNLETVRVGDPGNSPDMRTQDDGTSGYGSVAYGYNIGKYEVTAGQYAEFLNHKAKSGEPYGLYNADMWSGSYGCRIQRTGDGTLADPFVYSVASDWANRPVNFVSFWDACRFTNWLNNGQGDGDTETGAYALNGYNGNDGFAIGRDALAKWAVTGEDEWYKAAYYKGGGSDAGYWDYPTRSNSAPANKVLSIDPGNSANYEANGFTINSPYYRTSAGEFENSGSTYGTFDQGGNVWEWNDAVALDGHPFRGLRGGSCFSIHDYLEASYRNYIEPMVETNAIGFRVSQVPEPSSIIVLAGGLISLGKKRRKTQFPVL